MEAYIYRGLDSHTDFGRWTVVIMADNREEADREFQRHLNRLNRLAYLKDYKCEETGETYGVVYSNIEHG